MNSVYGKYSKQHMSRNITFVWKCGSVHMPVVVCCPDRTLSKFEFLSTERRSRISFWS